MIVSWFIPVNHRDYNAMPASVWIRCLQLVPYLEKRGIHCIVNDPEARADVYVFVRWQNEEAQKLARKLKQCGSRIVFDLCVNYFDVTGLFPGGYGVTEKHVEECHRMLELADAVTCASAYIAQRASELHRHAVYLSDSINNQHFCHRKSHGDFYRPKLRAVWSGISVKAHEIEPVLPLLQEKDIPLSIISDSPPELSCPYYFLRWSYDGFPKDILKGEIGIFFRSLDNPYNLGHSLFKIGVFMAQGVPVIASPMPSYAEVLGQGLGGRLLHNLNEWEETLDQILHCRDVLAQWSWEAVAALIPYHTERVIERYVALFQDLMQLRE